MYYRLSDRTRSSLTLENFQRTQSEIDRLATEISSGKRVINPHDDPSSYNVLMKYRDTTFQNQSYISNSRMFKSELELAENKVGDLTDKIKDLKQLLLEMGNSATYEQFKETYKNRLDTTMKSILNIANSKIKGRYMFAGSRSDTLPFDAVYSGNEIIDVIYRGDNQPLVINSDSSGKINVNLSGQAMIGGRAGMGEDLFEAMIAIRDDMDGNQLENLDHHLDTVDRILTRTIDKRGEIGSHVQHLELIEQFLGNFEMTIQQKASEIEGVDLAFAITELLNYEMVYKSSMEVAARLDRLSFLDYI